MYGSDIKTIGIPRAMSYYYNYPFYHAFFETLGINVVVSDKTTSKTVNAGCKICASETCLPIKVFAGHVLNLIDKGIFNIFIPSIQSTDYKINNCSKIRGLPDIIRNIVDIPINIIEPELNVTLNKGYDDFFIETARYFGITDKSVIKKAIKTGWEKYNRFFDMTKKGYTYQEALKNCIQEDCRGNKNIVVSRNDGLIFGNCPISIVIMAHGYNLFDEKISLNLIKKLEKMNVNVYTYLNVSKKDSLQALNKLEEIVYWANEQELTGTAAYFMTKEEENKPDGIIALSAFGCGPDSLMVEEISYHAKNMNIPLLHLTIDEHTGEAGFNTRLEAFIDMIGRRNIKKSNKKLKIF